MVNGVFVDRWSSGVVLFYSCFACCGRVDGVGWCSVVVVVLVWQVDL